MGSKKDQDTTTIGTNESLVVLHETLSRALVTPNSSSNNLHEKALQEKQEETQRKALSPRPLKKRKISIQGTMATQVSATQVSEAVDAGEDEALIRRKQLAAKLRAKGVCSKLVLKPSSFARTIFVKNTRQYSSSPIIELPPFYDPTPADVDIHQNHSHKLYNYVRKGTDMEGFKEFVRELRRKYNSSNTSMQGNQPFRCCNKFGESLIHLTCRRGRTEMTRFLVEELVENNAVAARQTLTVRDDCLKTPLHDACWTPTPNFELVELILKHCPEQVLMADIRGNTPFDYIRKEDTNLWLKFLWQRKHLLRGISTSTTMTRDATPSNVAIPSN